MQPTEEQWNATLDRCTAARRVREHYAVGRIVMPSDPVPMCSGKRLEQLLGLPDSAMSHAVEFCRASLTVMFHGHNMDSDLWDPAKLHCLEDVSR